jgi:apolipoprotein N-acyltransferase
MAWLLPAASGAMLGLASPPYRASELAWLALIPLFFAVENCDRGEAFRRGYVAGLVFFGMTTWWTLHVTVAGMVGLVAFLALYFGAAALAFRELSARDDRAWRNVLVAFVFTAVWVTLEWVRGKFLFGGFGWNGLGVSQYQALPLIQIASVTGVYGVSAMVCLINVTLFFTIRRFVRQLMQTEVATRRLSWEFYVAMILVCGSFLYGLKQMPRAEETSRQLRVALVQGNIPQSLKFNPSEKQMIIDRYRKLTAAAAVSKPDLIIWPESATPAAVRYDPDSLALVTNPAVASQAFLLTGTLDATPMKAPVEAFNAAVLVNPEGKLVGLYHKRHLVPFGEYVPLRKILPFLKWLTPIGESFERGREWTVFEACGYRFAAVICFEDTVPDLYRRFVGQGVDFMVNLTNDAWFKDSPAAELHLANAVFRAVETRRPLVRCTNNGVTGIVTAQGLLDKSTKVPLFSEGLWVGELNVPTRLPATPYVLYGDWFVGVCALVAAAAAAVLALNARRRS